MGEIVKLPGSTMSADEVLAAEHGRFDRVLVVGITKDGKAYSHVGGFMQNSEIVFLCEMMKYDVLSGGEYSEPVGGVR